MSFTSHATADLEPRDTYKLLTGVIVPRPIAWAGTVSRAGVPNLAPFSFFNVMTARPPTVVMGPGRTKDTLANIREVEEWTVSIVDRALAEQMNASSASFPPGVDEFAEVGVTAVPGTDVAAPWVGEAPAALECVLHSILEFEGTGIVVGQVVRIHVRDDVLDGTRIDQEALDAIGRTVGSGYITSRDRFEMERPA
ncbi:MAG: flavin reductase family protein [Acidimicrobiia bacterium]|nr:flavin reductase family protein [Acidimicrobiia bacterium]